MIRVCSEVGIRPLSKCREAMISVTACSMSADLSIKHGVLIWPVPSTGTWGGVDDDNELSLSIRIRLISGCFDNTSIVFGEHTGSHWMAKSGAPTSRAAFCMSFAADSEDE